MSKTSDDSSKELALKQIIAGGLITLGSTLFSIGVTIWVLSLTVLDKVVFKENTILKLDGLTQLSDILMIIGLPIILLGFFVPMYQLRKNPQNIKRIRTCNCGTVFRCPIHDLNI